MGEKEAELTKMSSPCKSSQFCAHYLGSKTMDKLYSQTMQPWVMAEVRRRKSSDHNVVIDIAGETLTVASGNTEQEENKVLFHHHLRGLTRFAKLHQDPRCFAYLTRYQANADFECHVFLATAEEVIPEIFKAIREASKGVTSKMSSSGQSSEETAAEQSHQAAETDTHEHEHADAGNSLFEVKNLGYARVGGKRVTSEVIDQLAEKMLSLEEDHLMRLLEQKEMDKILEDEKNNKHRGSGSSMDSLPGLRDQFLSPSSGDNKMKEPSSLVIQRDAGSPSLLSSAIEAATRRRHFSQQDLSSARSSNSSLEVTFHDRQRRASGDLLHHKDGQSQRSRHPSSDSQDQDEHSMVVVSSSTSGSNSGIALLHIGQHELSLLSLDTKTYIMESKFSNISFVSQGNHKQDVFGIVARSAGSVFICHILKCLNDSVVTEVMNTLQAAFTSAYNRTGNQDQAGSAGGSGAGSSGTGQQAVLSHHSCNSCPLFQLHRLCQEIHALSSQAAHDILLKKVHSLPEKDISAIRKRVQDEAPESFEESVEVMMICLHQLCERRQQEHVHISEAGARVPKLELGLTEEKHTLFEGLKNKARKSLTTSFENLLSRGRKKDDLKDGYRQRSWTATDSEASWTSKDSSAHSTPDASPLPSPLRKDCPHQFPSPPSSPAMSPSSAYRKRSSTLDSPGSSAPSGGGGTTAARRRDFNHNKTASPVKNITTVLTASSPQQSDSVPELSSSSQRDHALHPSNLSQRRPSASWRKAIFQRVVTAQQSDDVAENDACEAGQGTNVRDMWRKAFLETLLLIRMEKENHTVRARQEEGGVVLSRKLDYQELTPCLKEITSVWEEMLSNVHEDVEGAEEKVVRGDLGEGEEAEEGEKEEKLEEEDEDVTPRVKIPPVSQETLLEYVKKGVPRSLRGQIWLFLMQQRQLSGVDAVDDDTGDGEPLINRGRAPSSSVDYEGLLKQLTTHQHAILIDLGRTFPSHPYFSKSLGAGQLELFNLLKAYSLLDTEVGYCQGLSFIVGMLLMHMEEISAFHVLKYMMYDLGLRKQFKPNMTALQMKLYQLTRLLHDHCRDVYDHFEGHDISPTLYAAPWFLTLFASQFPLGFVSRVFDMIFVQGIDVLFKVALMLLVNHRALILQCNSFETVVDFLKTTLPEMVQVQMERVISQAFELDITRDLQAYEIEYHVIGEELAAMEGTHNQPHLLHHNNRNNPLHPSHPQHPLHHSLSKGPSPLPAMERPSRFLNRRRSSIDFELMYRMEHQNRALKIQNSELVEKLQHAQSQQRTSELAIHANKIEQDKLKSHIRTLEIERAALLTTVATMKRLLPHDALARLNLNLNLSHLPAAVAENMALSPSSTTASPHEPQTITFTDPNSSVLDSDKVKTECEDSSSKVVFSSDVMNHSESKPFEGERSSSPSAAAKSTPPRQNPHVHQPMVKREKTMKAEVYHAGLIASPVKEETKSISMSGSGNALSASNGSPPSVSNASPTIPSQ